MLYQTFAHTIPASYAVLPDKMRSPEATAMLLAIGMQESGFAARRQLPKGPARGFWQFERGGGVHGVLTHSGTARYAARVLEALSYSTEPNAYAVHTALEHNDVLACCFARLLLWTLPEDLPGRLEVDAAWSQYLAAWRPGKPHVSNWPRNYRTAWLLVDPEPA